jgi:hypothetical protein
MSTALQIVKQFFPQVEDVKDAKHPLVVEVTKSDNNSAKVRDHKACAMAVACKRAEKADGVIVSVMTAYVVKGNTAVRYHLPESVSREVVSFDRNAGFEPGEYAMIPPCATSRIGKITGGNNHANGRTGRKLTVRKHHTIGIRTVLGAKLQ